MADVLIRGLDDDVLERLKRRAERAGRSLQSETKLILQRAAGRSLDESLAVAARWRTKLGKRKSDSVKSVAEDRRR
jgi:plasmid stability protein